MLVGLTCKTKKSIHQMGLSGEKGNGDMVIEHYNGSLPHFLHKNSAKGRGGNHGKNERVPERDRNSLFWKKKPSVNTASK